MWRIYLPWPTWLEGIAVLRASAVEHQRRPTELMHVRRDETPANVGEPCLSLSDDVVLRAVNGACVQLELRLPDRGG